MFKLEHNKKIELKVKLLIALSQHGWNPVSGSSLLCTASVAIKTFPSLNATKDAILYISPYDDEGEYQLTGEFESRGENAVGNIINHFPHDADQETINIAVSKFIQEAEANILNSFACRMALSN